MLQKNIPVVVERISNICERPMEFIVTLKKVEQNQTEKEVEMPEQVKILLNTFKGTVIAGKQ